MKKAAAAALFRDLYFILPAEQPYEPYVKNEVLRVLMIIVYSMMP